MHSLGRLLLALCATAIAGTAAAAILACRSQTPILIVSDVDLGAYSCNGPSVLNHIDPQASVPKVLVTGCEVDEGIEAMLAEPNCALVGKPFTHQQLRDAIERVLLVSAKRAPGLSGPAMHQSAGSEVDPSQADQMHGLSL